MSIYHIYACLAVLMGVAYFILEIIAYRQKKKIDKEIEEWVKDMRKEEQE